PFNGYFRRNIPNLPCVSFACFSFNNFELQSMCISEAQRRFTESFCFVICDVKFPQSVFPEWQGANWNNIGSDACLTGANFTLTCTSPREERNNRSRLSTFVTKVYIICSWIIKVNGLLHHSQS